MHLDIITPEKKLLSEEIAQITVPAINGEITILPHHENLVTSLVSGEMIVLSKGKQQYLGITGGFLEVSNNSVTILADYAVKSEDIIVEKAIAAQKRAEEILKKSKESISERDYALAQSDFRRAIMELHVSHKRRLRNL
jgi:F-type H+-transporting ATPase subunit epsilon